MDGVWSTDIIPAIGDENKHVRFQALENLCVVMEFERQAGGLEPGVLAHHIVPRLDDEYWRVRDSALQALRNLEPGVLAEYADDIVPRLEDEHWVVRDRAVRALWNLEPGVLTGYVCHIVPMLEDDDLSVRNSAVRALGNLEPEVLADYADCISRMLTDEYEYVRLNALRALLPLGSRVYARYAGEIVSCLALGDNYFEACTRAVDALAEVPSVALVPHRHTLQTLQALQLNEEAWDKFRSLRGRVWLVRWRQLFWCQRFLWWWGSRACGPGSRQARAAASEFGRMQDVSAEEEGEREVKRVRVV